jgi:integrase
MPRYRKVNVKLLTKANGAYYEKNKASPWMLVWRDPKTKKQRRRFDREESRARKAAAIIEAKINQGVVDILPRGMSWVSAVKLFLSRPMKESTYLEYENSLERFGAATGYPASDHWSVLLLEMFKEDRQRGVEIEVIKRINGKKISADGKYVMVKKIKVPRGNTINKDLRGLSVFFNWCKAVYDTPNPFDRLPRGLKRIKASPKVKSVWTKEQFLEFLDRLTPEWRIAAILGIHGVGRKKDILKLRVGDFDFIANTVRMVDETAAEKTGKEKFAPIKTKWMKEIQDYIDNLPDGTIKIFPPIMYRGIWDSAIIKAKVPRVTFHGLRTVMTTWIVEGGDTIDGPSHVLQHSSTAVTKKNYNQANALTIDRRVIESLPI